MGALIVCIDAKAGTASSSRKEDHQVFSNGAPR